jgi:hypothetical protein
MIDFKSPKVQLGFGLPALFTAALAFADYRYVDHKEMEVSMNQVTHDRREDQLYLITRNINRLKVLQGERQLAPEELQRLLDLESDARRLDRLLRERH